MLNLKSMKTGNYSCLLCEKEFEPIKRGTQKFCSKTCRNKHNYHKNKSKKIKEGPCNLKARFENTTKEKIGVDVVTGPGVIQAALGTLVADGAKALGKKMFLSDGEMPATKQDIYEINQNINDLKHLINTRYFLIKGMDRRFDGALPHFDMSSRSLVYLMDPNFLNPADYIP